MDTLQLKTEILEFIKTNPTKKYDMVDISNHFSIKYGITVDIPAMALHELEKENKVQRIEGIKTVYKIIE